MNIDIRKSIINNFKDATNKEIEESITETLKDNNELALPGLGVFFEILWRNSNDNLKRNIIDIIKRNLN